MERWGSTWNRYYMMDTQYFMADLTKRMVDILAKNFTWISVLSVSLKNDVEYKAALASRINKIATTIENGSPAAITSKSTARTSSASSMRGKNSNNNGSSSSSSSVGGGGGGGSVGSIGGGSGTNKLQNANDKAKELGMEQSVSGYTQVVKEAVFSKP